MKIKILLALKILV